MIDRNGNYKCGYCGDPMRQHKGKTAPECCSEPCAKDYAKDMGHPDEWRGYLESVPACPACGGPKDDNRYRWCDKCKEAWRSLNAP